MIISEDQENLPLLFFGQSRVDVALDIGVLVAIGRHNSVPNQALLVLFESLPYFGDQACFCHVRLSRDHLIGEDYLSKTDSQCIQSSLFR